MKGAPAASSKGAWVRSLGALAVSGAVVQLSTALSQVVAVAVLSPHSYGHWAAAMSALVIPSALLNLGEVKALAAGVSGELGASRRRAGRINVVLLAIGVSISGMQWFLGREQIAWLSLLIAFGLPLQGAMQYDYAILVRGGKEQRLAVVQVLAALARFLVFLIALVMLQTSTAFALALATLPLVMRLALRRAANSAAELIDLEDASSFDRGITFRARCAWALNSSAHFLPTQIDYLVLSIVASAEMLGVYFLAYQMTVGIASVLIVPVARKSASLFQLAKDQAELRSFLVVTTGLVSAIILVLGSGCSILLVLVENALPSDWAGIVVVTQILFAGTAFRVLVPVLDSADQVSDRWGTSTAWNVLDATGVAVCALTTAVTHDITVTAALVALWQVTLSWARIASRLGVGTLGHLALTLVSLGALALVVGGLASGYLRAAVPLGIALACGVTGLLVSARQMAGIQRFA